MPKAQSRTPKGLFITFEGGEGAGKSTQMRLLAEKLCGLGREVVATREPGGTPFAERVRALILDPATPKHSPLSEALLFYAARADHLERVIRPALGRGAIVLADRFSDSTEVYQCLAGGLSSETFAALEAAVVGAEKPDLTIVLDLDPVAGLERARTRGALNAYDARSLAYHQRLREGFLAIARREPERCVVLDAAGVAEVIAARIWSVVEARLAVAGA